MSLAIIIPALNEADNIRSTLTSLQAMRARGVRVIVVDGGSTDATTTLAAGMADLVISSTKGRAAQMNVGAAACNDDWLLFLHADSMLPPDADQRIATALGGGQCWGRFDIRITGGHFMFAVISWFMNHRSRLTGIATGDQGLFMTRRSYDAIGGFPAQSLMEDVELCKRLKGAHLAGPALLAERITTSGRRWQQHGVWRTILLMWRLRFQYWRGTPAAELHAAYYRK